MIYAQNGDGLTFRYSNKTHLLKTKRLKYANILKNYKDKHTISKIENQLSNYNSKTCNYTKFKQFVKNKNVVNQKLFGQYEDVIFRKYKWYGYINKKRAEDELVNSIAKVYGKDVKICIGDWGRGKNVQLKHFISTPNLSLKRKICKNFITYNLDEFRTSMLDFKNENKCENLCLPDAKGEVREIHSILTYQMENGRLGCINRDENSVRNMIKIVKSFISGKGRPKRFCRSEEIKDNNPLTIRKKSKVSNVIKPVKGAIRI